MKNFIKYSIIFISMLCSAGSAFGQTPPVTVTIDSKTYYRHGYNSRDDGTVLQPREVRDSVTLTSEMKYFVLPDEVISPEYTLNMTDFSKVNSTFAWTFGTTAHGSITTGSGTPLVTVRWNIIGDDELKVVETPNAGASGCGDGAPTTMPVVVIPKPTVAFTPNTVAPEYAAEACEGDLTGGYLKSFSLNVVTQSTQVNVSYTVTRNGVGYPALDGTDVRVKITGTSPDYTAALPITFTEYGAYEITITNVTDRISRKPATVVNGDVIPAGEKFTFNLIRPIRTGPIYRLPNNY